jgi:DNA-directed RNA polymerase subunit RPC12/RpoP
LDVVFTILSYADIFIFVAAFWGVLIFIKKIKKATHMLQKNAKASIIKKITIMRREKNGSVYVDKGYYNLTFQTEDGLHLAFDVSPELYNAVMKGDCGTLFFEQSKQLELHFVNFFRDNNADQKTVSPEAIMDMTCPNCGAAMDVDRRGGVASCAFCGSKVVIPLKQPVKKESAYALPGTAEKAAHEAAGSEATSEADTWQIKYKTVPDPQTDSQADVPEGAKKKKR